jgi:uncharacterized membrane protein
MMDYIKAGIVALVAFAAMDALWLGVIAKTLYKEQLGALMREQPNWWVAVFVYIFMVAGFVWFVFPQIMMTRSVLQALQCGGRFGVILYGLYECTNYATIIGWPLPLVVIDTLWGGVLFSAASIAVYYLRNIW